MIWKFMGISTLIMFYIQERRKSFGVQEIPLRCREEAGSPTFGGKFLNKNLGLLMLTCS
jgi:hypothetical protein